MGVGISRSVLTLLEAVKKLDDPLFVQLIKEDMLVGVKAEADTLKPALAILDAGKGSQYSATARLQLFGKSSRRRPAAALGTPSFDWLSNESSVLRTFLSVVAGKGARHILHKPASKEVLRVLLPWRQSLSVQWIVVNPTAHTYSF